MLVVVAPPQKCMLNTIDELGPLTIPRLVTLGICNTPPLTVMRFEENALAELPNTRIPWPVLVKVEAIRAPLAVMVLLLFSTPITLTTASLAPPAPNKIGVVIVAPAWFEARAPLAI